jgi:sensor histidine kinase regulating citrate/malate metabolism
MVIENFPAGTRIKATDFLLGVVFWNLWINSQQAVGKGCKIVAHVTTSMQHLELLLVDNGEGFPPDIGVAGFPDAKPRPGHRGRGLLEIQEAVERLHGVVGLVRHSDGTYRVRLRFPLETS